MARPYFLIINHNAVATSATATTPTALSVGNFDFHITKTKASASVTSTGVQTNRFTFQLQRSNSDYLFSAEISSLMFQAVDWLELPEPWVLGPNDSIMSSMTNGSNANIIDAQIALAGVLLPHIG